MECHFLQAKQTIQNILQYWTPPTKKEAVHYLCDFPTMYINLAIYQFYYYFTRGNLQIRIQHVLIYPFDKVDRLYEQITMGTRNE
jgi:hypothetical protein